MAMKLLHLCLLLVLLSPSRATNCDECIQSGPETAWCTAPQSDIRCNSLKELQSAGCLEDHIYNPQGVLQVVKNDNSTEPENAKDLFLQPQEVSIHLRPGVPQSFPLIITMPSDQSITVLAMDTSPLPAGVNVTLGDVVNGNPLVVQVNVEAAQCPSESDDSNQTQNSTGPWSVHITPRGSSLSVKVEITLDCQCDCSRNREEDSLDCSGHGALVCGQCECNTAYFGLQCQFRAGPDEEACQSNPNAPVCSGRGKCVGGFCECEERENPDEKYTGKFCECGNFDCPLHDNRTCGGHGKCRCGECICDDTWSGEDCSCTTLTASCMANNQSLCNGQGTCECGTCKCSSPFKGQTCESCPACFSCDQHSQCVQCRAFGVGSLKDRCDEECDYLKLITVPTKDDLPKPYCTTTSPDSCEIQFRISRTTTGVYANVVQVAECPQK